MLTLYELGLEIAKIREHADAIEVKGQQNAVRVILIINKCNELIEAINQASEAAQNAMGGGEQHGEPDSGTAP